MAGGGARALASRPSASPHQGGGIGSGRSPGGHDAACGGPVMARPLRAIVGRNQTPFSLGLHLLTCRSSVNRIAFRSAWSEALLLEARTIDADRDLGSFSPSFSPWPAREWAHGDGSSARPSLRRGCGWGSCPRTRRTLSSGPTEPLRGLPRPRCGRLPRSQTPAPQSRTRPVRTMQVSLIQIRLTTA